MDSFIKIFKIKNNKGKEIKFLKIPFGDFKVLF